MYLRIKIRNFFLNSGGGEAKLNGNSPLFMSKEAKAPLALILLLSILVIASSDSAIADPCLVVYPDVSCVYHYDDTEYYTVGPGHPLYDPEYDRGGEVLLEVGTDEIDMSIYQAPNLTGFEVSIDGNEGYAFLSTQFDIVVDGFSNSPTTYHNILLVFDQISPEDCSPTILVNGQELEGSSYPIGDLVVSTPTEEGNNYSDVVTVQVEWSGCYGVHIWAFADEDYNGIHDGNECFTAFSHDAMIDTEEASWGEVKSGYK